MNNYNNLLFYLFLLLHVMFTGTLDMFPRTNKLVIYVSLPLRYVIYLYTRSGVDRVVKPIYDNIVTL